MPLPHYLQPKRLGLALASIDNDPTSYSMERWQATKRAIYSLIVFSISLYLVSYLKSGRQFRELIWFLEETGFLAGGDESILRSTYDRLYSYGWWTLWQFLGYMLIPILFIKLVLKESLREHGFQWGDTTEYLSGYLVLLTPMSIGAIAVSFTADFSNYYPMYGDAGRSWFDLLAWQALYFFQFVCIEFFFRGFILHALRPALGANAIFVMCVPYMMIHFPKPMLEPLVALAFGIFAAILAFRSRSIWGGVFIHITIALIMDITALLQKNEMPTLLFPLH